MEDVQRTYRVSGVQSYFMLAVLAMITCAGSAAVFLAGHMGWFAVAWFGVLGWLWFNALIRVAYRIDVSGEEVTFRSVTRRRQTRISSIHSIRSRQGGMATIRFGTGRVDVIGPVDGWYEFVTLAKTANPACELKGV